MLHILHTSAACSSIKFSAARTQTTHLGCEPTAGANSFWSWWFHVERRKPPQRPTCCLLTGFRLKNHVFELHLINDSVSLFGQQVRQGIVGPCKWWVDTFLWLLQLFVADRFFTYVCRNMT